MLHYLRFKRGYPLVATEVGKFYSDVLASNFEEIIEVEVKTTLADFINDFKKNKHEHYARLRTHHNPQKFYFAVPEKIAAKALEKLQGTKYGLMVVSEDPFTKYSELRFVSIVKQATNLKEKYSKKLEWAILQRLSSEFVSLRVYRHHFESKKQSKLEQNQADQSQLHAQ